MEYTIKEVAEISELSIRTLLFYEKRGLLMPADLDGAGYRRYTEKEMDKLQQILLYRSAGVPLRTIKNLVDRPAERILETLLKQRAKVVEKQKEVARLLQAFDNTLLYYKGEIKMMNKERFGSLQHKSLIENKENYGEEIRESYGGVAVESSNQNWLEMSDFDYLKMDDIENQLFDKLSRYVKEGGVPSSLAEEIFSLHRLWLQYSWEKYTKEAHRSLSELYLSDEHFTDYYDGKCGLGATEALCEIIQYYTK